MTSRRRLRHRRHLHQFHPIPLCRRLHQTQHQAIHRRQHHHQAIRR